MITFTGSRDHFRSVGTFFKKFIIEVENIFCIELLDRFHWFSNYAKKNKKQKTNTKMDIHLSMNTNRSYLTYFNCVVETSLFHIQNRYCIQHQFNEVIQIWSTVQFAVCTTHSSFKWIALVLSRLNADYFFFSNGRELIASLFNQLVELNWSFVSQGDKLLLKCTIKV